MKSEFMVIVLLLSRHIHGLDMLRYVKERKAYWELVHRDQIHARLPFKEQEVSELMDCLQLCLQDDNGCRSVNYKYAEQPHTCQLLKYNRHNAPVYSPLTGWKHYDTGHNQFVSIKTYGQSEAGGKEACYVQRSPTSEFFWSQTDVARWCEDETALFEYDPVMGTLFFPLRNAYLCLPSGKAELDWTVTDLSWKSQCVFEFDQRMRFRRTHYAITWAHYCIQIQYNIMTRDHQKFYLGPCDHSILSVSHKMHTAIKAPIKVSVFLGISGIKSRLADAKASISDRFPHSPSYIGYNDAFVQQGWSEGSYMLRMQTIFTPLTNGQFVFYCANWAFAEVYLSTDENEANKQLIINSPVAHHTTDIPHGWDFIVRRQQSAPIALLSGTKYYMEVEFFTNNKAGFLQVAMRQPQSTTIEIIESNHFSPLPSEMAS